ncbi:MAG: exodeoxyribonuclease V subunit beta [Alteromonadaceae bacterium]|nr:exodeoxyribonuclease V subunit beta [Alteromonadaceae bacterium]
MNQPKNLVAHEIELTGKHLIEASAGTGKTYNITRIYLRLLLERRLSVQQILVMTFTKDATEELRGRIDSFIREAINNWSSLIIEDEYFAAIASKIDEAEAQILLKTALLFIDEAAIFTIHGFCKRILNQHAFASGVSFNALMEASSQDLELEACQDWYRVLAKQSPDQFLLVAEFWAEPQTFFSQFSKAIAKNNPLDLVSPKEIELNFQQLAQQALNSLRGNHQVLLECLVEVKAGSARQVRLDELNALLSWLENISAADVENNSDEVIDEKIKSSSVSLSLSSSVFLSSNMPDSFIDGRRFSRAKNKAELVEIFIPVNEVKNLNKNLNKLINKAKAFSIVREGIYKIRLDIERKKQTLNMLNFDDLISTLANTLSVTQDGNNELANILFKQYPVALVDEFQDTDPLQFEILRAIYYSQKNATLYMIGDPKQAIYGFRGGDVFAYLSARKDCDHQWLMDTNWRSTPKMIQGYNRLFYGNNLDSNPREVFGYEIPYLPVKAAPRQISNCEDNHFSALQFIHFTADEDEKTVKQSFRPVMANWCASEIKRLLSNSDSDFSNREKSNLTAQNIAILVRDGSEAAAIKLALQEQNLSSVFLSNRANLLHSKQAQQLIMLLKGILFLENERLFTAGLACGLLGFTPDKLYLLQQDELAWQALKFTFSALRDEWLYKGYISMALKLMHEHFNLSIYDGGSSNSQSAQGTGTSEDSSFDRSVTNLLHLFELLQSASGRHRQPQELIYWFEQQISLDNPDSEAELRLESDDNLIRIITQHGSKGLEYPIVFVPFATRHKDPLRFGTRSVSFIEYHDQQGKLHLSLDGSDEAKKSMADEAYAEAIRLLYVAITRAEQRCYVFSTAFEHCHNSPLGRTLKWEKGQTGEQVLLSLQQLANENPDAIGVLEVGVLEVKGGEPSELEKNVSVSHNLSPANSVLAEVATFKGKIERDWWLSSFSALSKNLRHGGVSTPDRDNESVLLIDQSDKVIPSSLIRFNITKGAQTGNLLHDILEHTDFAEPDWQSSMQWPLLKYGELKYGEWGKSYQEEDLQVWLEQVINAPLASKEQTGNNFCLKDIVLTRTLRESEFYFPMNSASSSALAKLLTDHRKKSAQILSDVDNVIHSQYQVKLPAYQKLKGMMHGFIDLVFEHEGKYYVCDYKSSHLGDHFKFYSKQDLLLNIEKNYYDLQYLIYCLALHRHLKNSLSDYDAKQHFGGVYYLYLRGMTDETEHQGAGVYYRHISEHELNCLDDLFLGVESSGVESSGVSSETPASETQTSQTINGEKVNTENNIKCRELLHD